MSASPGFTTSVCGIKRHIASHGFSHEDEFLFGLDLILDGLDARLDARRDRRRFPRSRLPPRATRQRSTRSTRSTLADPTPLPGK